VKTYLVGLTAPALQALLQYVATTTILMSAADRDHYAATIKWLIDHGVSQLAQAPYEPAHAPEVLPNQLPLF
jgi:hypothetical protein